ncbi:cobyric acid synthase [Hypericibacter terrae]|uniref:Cobyric acid synthase n=2 Tax=Hypericibacter terrae TaxID=2602015 RepID=A0A5J6MPU7_9PROT|nr:cobyric acid synthase [Hypericibacter terrae]
MKTPAIMLQGTGSDVGKSLLTAGLARAFTKRGLKVRPFKPQNMSNNAAVTEEGGEIGRAQALQARACGVKPSVHMNPVLLKPQSEVGAQVVLQGRIYGKANARVYHALKPTLMPAVLESFGKLSAEADLVLIEGAGSPAEVNLREGDIANMGFAEAADVPVLLIGDIDRGGVIASLVGTAALLAPSERARIKGFIINKFRGDPTLFAEGMKIITERTGLPALGLLPFWPRAMKLPAEDAVVLPRYGASEAGAFVTVAVPMLNRIANFDDLDPLRAEPSVRLVIVPPGEALPGNADLVVLPGSKSTIADLRMLKAEGWDTDLKSHIRRGGRVIGVCGGYQMLGRRVADPYGIEGPPGEEEGLGLLDLDTELGRGKTLTEASGRERSTGEPVRGYEMHVGNTEGSDLKRPMLDLDGRPDGAVSADGRVMGCYLHGIFAADGYRRALLRRLVGGNVALGPDFEAEVEATLDALAAHIDAHVDLDRIWEIARGA